jgi:hypothetical protein
LTSETIKSFNNESVIPEPLGHAIDLLNQQTWYWVRDILRTEGNWLVTIGLSRLNPPADRKECASIYTLELPEGRCVVLRGFCVFYGDQQHGGVFLPRYEFRPKYTTQARLESPPWSVEDLPILNPLTILQRHACATLTLNVIDWIRRYEVTVIERLGIEYRRRTLLPWNNGNRHFTPAEKFASAWRLSSLQVGANFDIFSGQGDT